MCAAILIFQMEMYEIEARDKIENLMPIARMDVDTVEQMIEEVQLSLDYHRKGVYDSLDELLDSIMEWGKINDISNSV